MGLISGHTGSRRPAFGAFPKSMNGQGSKTHNVPEGGPEPQGSLSVKAVAMTGRQERLLDIRSCGVRGTWRQMLCLAGSPIFLTTFGGSSRTAEAGRLEAIPTLPRFPMRVPPSWRRGHELIWKPSQVGATPTAEWRGGPGCHPATGDGDHEGLLTP